MSEHAADDQDRVLAFTDLALMKTLDWQALRNRIAQVTDLHAEVSLGEVLQDSDPEYDAVEVLGLVQIAHEDGHNIDPEKVEVITVRHADGTVAELEIPTVTFKNTLNDAGITKH